MAVAASTQVINLMAQSKDIKKDIYKIVGNLDGVKVKWNMVLVATYIRPERTAGGIIRPNTNVAEDEWQGKVGLVLKLGPMAYQDDEETSFQGEKVDVGEWAVYKTGDAWSLNVNGYPCRLVKDSAIRMVVDDPSIIF